MLHPRNKYFLWLLCLILIPATLTISSCEQDEPVKEIPSTCNPAEQPGELLGAELKISITKAQGQSFLDAFGAPIGYTADYGVDVYKLSYNTLDKNDVLTRVSGLLVIPQGLDTYDLMSVQHGTSIKRNEVGSVSPIPYAIDALLMAMDGYLVVAPDYLGLGDSQLLHPYLHAQLSANAVMDIIRAARAYACEQELNLSDKLFLAGYSEGGYVTLAAQRIMETDHAAEFQLTAVAPMAGPFDLSGSTRTILQQETYANPAFPAFMVAAYNDVYGWDRLSDIFNAPYATAIPSLFDGTKNAGEINSQLTTRIDLLFKADFIAAYLSGGEPALNAALEANSFLNWGPIAPVKLIHGTADETVPYANSVTVQTWLLENGGVSVDLVPIQNGDHLSSAFTAYFIAGEWFNSLRSN